MADIFQQSDAKRLLFNKYVMFLGDSNCRALYKDLVWLLNSNSLIENHVLKRKLEFSFLGDQLLERTDLTKGRDFREVRLFEENGFKVFFRFLTRCYSDEFEKLIKSFPKEGAPDVIFISSCLWDISRWGPGGVTAYKDNLIKVMKLLKSYVPPSTLIIWGTALPISSEVRSGFLIKQIEFLRHLLRFEVMEANMFARQIVVNYGYDVLDLHYHMRMQIHRRAKDGVHYNNLPVRLMTNLILTHIALAFGVDLPNNITNSLLVKKIDNVKSNEHDRLNENIPVILKELNVIADNIVPNNLENYLPKNSGKLKKARRNRNQNKSINLRNVNMPLRKMKKRRKSNRVAPY